MTVDSVDFVFITEPIGALSVMDGFLVLNVQLFALVTEA